MIVGEAQFYGFLSNRYTSCMVASDGTVEWLPFPRFDGDAVFCRLLDETQGGFLSIRPETKFTAVQRYIPDCMTLETRLDTVRGQATIHDFLPIGRTSLWRFPPTSCWF